MSYKLSCPMLVSTALMAQLTTASLTAHASVTPDRTRLVFNESDKSISVTLRNNNEKLPYLAQSWLEDEKGNKITSPLAVLPPVQRIDAMMNGQVKIQALPDIHTLPSDRESLFYYNVREIPPKSGKANTLQIALQTRIKLFWRPANIRLILCFCFISSSLSLRCTLEILRLEDSENTLCHTSLISLPGTHNKH